VTSCRRLVDQCGDLLRWTAQCTVAPDAPATQRTVISPQVGGRQRLRRRHAIVEVRSPRRRSRPDGEALFNEMALASSAVRRAVGNTSLVAGTTIRLAGLALDSGGVYYVRRTDIGSLPDGYLTTSKS